VFSLLGAALACAAHPRLWGGENAAQLVSDLRLDVFQFCIRKRTAFGALNEMIEVELSLMTAAMARDGFASNCV
jgi:hypothetical protein